MGLPKNFNHNVCKQCIKKQIEKYGKITIRCNGFRDSSLMFDNIDDKISDVELDKLKELYDPEVWAYNNLEVKPDHPWTPRQSRDGVKYQANLIKCSAYRQVFRLGRRMGKSESLAILILWYAVTNNNYDILVVAPFQSQLDEIFERVITYLETSPKTKSLKEKFTKTPHIRLSFKNGSVVKALPVSKQGNTVRSKSANLIIVDEGDYVDDGVWNSFLPILMDYPDTRLIIASTPSGRKSKFYQFAHDEKFKEWHYPTTLLPHWSKQMEMEMRKELTTLGYEREVLAEWGDSELLAISNEFIKKAIDTYSYSENNPIPEFIYSIGVDWNSYKNGTRIIVTEMDPKNSKWKIVDKYVITNKQWTQTKAIEKILSLIEKWHASYLYIDEGYGAVSLEVIKKMAINSNPDTYLYQMAMNNNIRAINFSHNLEIQDPLSNKKIYKPAKLFMVENMIRFFEKGLIKISKFDEELIKQLENYGVTGFRKDNGIPMYGAFDSDIGDHDVDALMLSLLPFTLESNLFKQNHLEGGIIVHNNTILPIKTNDNQEEDDDELYLEDVIDYREDKNVDINNDSFIGMPLSDFVRLVNNNNPRGISFNVNRLSRDNISKNRRPSKRTWR